MSHRCRINQSSAKTHVLFQVRISTTTCPEQCHVESAIRPQRHIPLHMAAFLLYKAIPYQISEWLHRFVCGGEYLRLLARQYLLQYQEYNEIHSTHREITAHHARILLYLCQLYVSLWWHSRAACCYAKPALLSMGWINKTAKHCVFQPRVASLSRTLTISSNYTTPWWICLPFIGKIFHLCLEANVFVLLCYRCVSDKHPWSRTLLKTSRVGVTEPMSSWESCRSFSPFFRFDVCPLYITFIFDRCPRSLHCGDICQIWTWCKGFDQHFCKCLSEGTNKLSLSTLHPWPRRQPDWWLLLACHA